MKTGIQFLIIFCCITSLAAQEVTVYGKIINPTDDKVFIGCYKEQIAYERTYADTAILNKDGEFIMRFMWNQPGYADFLHGDEYSPLFLQPGDSLKIELDAQMLDQTIKHSGKAARVNNYLAQKLLEFPAGPPSHFKLAENLFLQYQDSVYQSKLKFYSTHFSNTSKSDPALKRFRELEEAELLYDHYISKLNYPDYFAYFNGQKEPASVSPHYFDFLKEAQLNNPNAFPANAYLLFVRYYVDREVFNFYKKDSSQSMVQLKENYIDKHLKGNIREHLLADWAYLLLARQSDVKNGKTIYEKYLSSSKEKPHQEMLEKAYRNAERLAVGQPAPQFSLVDLNGQKVSLSDFKGKVVYMDIWASWCGPCVREIPFAKKLEEALHGKDIVFLNVSIDENLESWKKIIKDKDIKGIHVNSKGGSEAEFSKLYNVSGIPKYFIIDKNGLIANNNPQRPSGNVKEELEALLEENK
ncbi:MAG: TlpA family protein disulfide reductase [Saprospiraceae bacterium]|nr:TlpA family protein disulfide reductase [Saprospiraceae bacterium]